LGENRFRYAGEPSATSVFVNEDGDWKWLSESAYAKKPVWSGYTQFYLAVFCIVLMVLTFVYYLFLIPWKILRKRHLKLQLPLFAALISFVMLFIDILALYDPQKGYSAGAILFFVFGLLFLVFSLYSLYNSILEILRKSNVNRWLKWHIGLSSLACSITAIYLLYWDIIGLTLWSY